jgi:AI-2 transport protein TqsA
VLGGDLFARKLQVAFHDVTAVNAVRIYDTLNMKVLRYLRLKTLINLFTGLVVYAVLEAFGVDFAPVMGLLAFLFNYIPNIGSFIMTVLPGAIAAVQFENVGFALIIVGVLIVVQNLIGNIIEPKIMGTSLDISPVVVLFSLVFWGWMWGIVGMILSVPIMAVVKTLMEQFPTTKPLAILMGSTVPSSSEEFR